MPLFNDEASLIYPSHPGFVSGRYYASTNFASVSTSSYYGTGSVYYTYFFVPFKQTFNTVAFQNNNSLSATEEVRLAIYTVNSGLPSNLIIDLGTVSFIYSGYKLVPCSVSLSAGWYAIALQVTPNSVTLATPVINLASLLGQLSLSSNFFSGLRAPLAYGSFPSVASRVNLTEINAPLIWLKAA